jgi:hypothetical protein
MSFRAPVVMLLMFAAGCVTAGDAAEPPAAAVTQSTTSFQCLNDTSIHVVTCHGSISLFPITVTIDDLRILSDNELTILSGDLNDLSILDGDLLDHDKILDDVEADVVTDFLDRFLVDVTRNDVSVCTTVLGAVVCK